MITINMQVMHIFVIIATIVFRNAAVDGAFDNDFLSSLTQGKEIFRRIPRSERKYYFDTTTTVAPNNGTKTGSAFDYLYDSLLDNELNKMCSIMRQSEADQIMDPIGDFTILAPTDEAFALAPGSLLEDLQSDPQKRNDFIKRHIVPKRLELSRYQPGDEAKVKTMDGSQLHIAAFTNGFVLSGANVVNGDIPIGNTKNLLQMVDRILYPPPSKNLVELIKDDPNLQQMSSFLTLSGLEPDLLRNTYTCFIPNDEAFRAVPWSVTQQMLSNTTFLRKLIENHLIPFAKIYSIGLPGNQMPSKGGEILSFTTRPVQSRELILINSVPIISSDKIATNGVVNVITRMLLPKDLMDDCKCNERTTTDATTATTSAYNDTTEPNPSYKTDNPLDDNKRRNTPPPDNTFRRRMGKSEPNGTTFNHFSTPQHTVTFTTHWDDIFATPDTTGKDNRSDPYTNYTTQRPTFRPNVTDNMQTLDNITNSDDRRTSSVPITTESPFWDPFAPENVTQTAKYTTPENNTVERERQTTPWNTKQREFTPGVEYDDRNDTVSDQPPTHERNNQRKVYRPSSAVTDPRFSDENRTTQTSRDPYSRTPYEPTDNPSFVNERFAPNQTQDPRDQRSRPTDDYWSRDRNDPTKSDQRQGRTQDPRDQSSRSTEDYWSKDKPNPTESDQRRGQTQSPWDQSSRRPDDYGRRNDTDQTKPDQRWGQTQDPRDQRPRPTDDYWSKDRTDPTKPDQSRGQTQDPRDQSPRRTDDYWSRDRSDTTKPDQRRDQTQDPRDQRSGPTDDYWRRNETDSTKPDQRQNQTQDPRDQRRPDDYWRRNETDPTKPNQRWGQTPDPRDQRSRPTDDNRSRDRTDPTKPDHRRDQTQDPRDQRPRPTDDYWSRDRNDPTKPDNRRDQTQDPRDQRRPDDYWRRNETDPTKPDQRWGQTQDPRDQRPRPTDDYWSKDRTDPTKPDQSRSQTQDPRDQRRPDDYWRRNETDPTKPDQSRGQTQDPRDQRPRPTDDYWSKDRSDPTKSDNRWGQTQSPWDRSSRPTDNDTTKGDTRWDQTSRRRTDDPTRDRSDPTKADPRWGQTQSPWDQSSRRTKFTPGVEYDPTHDPKDTTTIDRSSPYDDSKTTFREVPTRGSYKPTQLYTKYPQTDPSRRFTSTRRPFVPTRPQSTPYDRFETTDREQTREGDDRSHTKYPSYGPYDRRTDRKLPLNDTLTYPETYPQPDSRYSDTPKHHHRSTFTPTTKSPFDRFTENEIETPTPFPENIPTPRPRPDNRDRFTPYAPRFTDRYPERGRYPGSVPGEQRTPLHDPYYRITQTPRDWPKNTAPPHEEVPTKITFNRGMAPQPPYSRDDPRYRRPNDRPVDRRYGQSSQTPPSQSHGDRGTDKPVDRRYGQSSQTPQSQSHGDRGNRLKPTLRERPKSISDILTDPNLIVDGKPQEFNILRDCLNRSGLLNVISRPASITIFMPTDDAFSSLPKNSMNSLLQNPNAIRNMLFQHMVNFNLSPQALRNNMMIPSIAGQPHIINIILGGKMILVDGIPVIAATPAQNGMVYVIGSLLYKPEGNSRKVMDEFKKRPELSTFNNLLRNSKFASKLQGQGPYTLFAPNNEAFNQSLRPLDEYVNNNDEVEKLLRNHIAEGAHYSKELINIPKLNLISGNPITLDVNPDGTINLNNDSKIIGPDISTGNGVIHIIDRILTPDDPSWKSPKRIGHHGTHEPDKSRDPKSLIQKIERQPTLAQLARRMNVNQFMRILAKLGTIEDIVKDGREYTIIAPTDKAITKLPQKAQNLLLNEPERLKHLLDYHVIPGEVNTSKLKDNDELPTLSGKNIRLNKYQNGSMITLSGAPITKEANHNNIKVLAVDIVLYPPQGTIYNIVSNSPILKILTKILQNSGLTPEMSKTGSGPYTLLAPKDDAIKNLEPEKFEELMRNRDSSRAFIMRHLIPSAFFTNAIKDNDPNGVDATNADGGAIIMKRKPDCVSANGVTLAYADITATNGVVHVVDHVL